MIQFHLHLWSYKNALCKRLTKLRSSTLIIHWLHTRLSKEINFSLRISLKIYLSLKSISVRTEFSVLLRLALIWTKMTRNGLILIYTSLLLMGNKMSFCSDMCRMPGLILGLKTHRSKKLIFQRLKFAHRSIWCPKYRTLWFNNASFCSHSNKIEWYRPSLWSSMNHTKTR